MNHYREYGENQTPRIWGEQEGCGSVSDTFYCSELGYKGQRIGYQQKRIDRKTGEGTGITAGGEIIGGILSQLIADCKEQIAGNNKIINTLHSTNQSLEEKVEFYQRLLDQVQE